MARTYSLFPKSYNLVRDDPNLYLLHTYYYRDIDTLFVLYKRYDTGEKFLDRIENPEVPVWISKQKPERHIDAVKIGTCDRVMVSYKNKLTEVKQELFDPKWVRYKDQFGFKVNRMLFPEIDNNITQLHPSLRFFDVPIEQIVYMEYCMNRYVAQGKLEYEDVKQPTLSFSAFDIETFKDETGLWHVHTNTFVDQDSGDSYIDILEDFAHFPRQEELLSHQKEFEAEFKRTLMERLQGIKKDEKSKKKILEKCIPIVEKLNIKIRSYKTEKDLISAVTRTMYTDYSPDINMAFNITYDKKHLYKRGIELGLPNGNMNRQGIGFDNLKPPFAFELNEQYDFKSDDVNPKKRCVRVNSLSHTVDACYQTAFYSQRQGTTYASYSLEATANEILGIGKVDFSHITNSIVRLPFHDYYVHCLYSLMDSVLLLLCNAVSPEFESKLAYCMATKTNLEDSALSSRAIARCVHTEYMVHGYVPMINISKVLLRMTRDEVEKASKILEIDLMKNYLGIIYSKSFSGGLVADPNKFQITQDVIRKYNVLSNEAYMTMFRKVILGLYMDYKSHYPNANIARNISRDTLFGNLISIEEIQSGEVLVSTDPKFKTWGKYRSHLGIINLAIINKDIISYGHITMGLPSSGELTLLNHSYDSPPKFSVEKPKNISFRLPNEYLPIAKILGDLNRLSITKTDEAAQEKDNKHFFFNDGDCAWDGNLISYRFKNGNDLLRVSGIVESDTSYYGVLYTKDKILESMNQNINVPKQSAFVFPEHIVEHPIHESFWEFLEDTDIFSKKFVLAENTPDELAMIGVSQCFYYPFLEVLKRYRGKKWNPKKQPTISAATVKIMKLKETAKCEMKFTLTLLDVEVTITQQFQTVLL